MNAPRPGRSYWICQAAGWGSFTAYVLSFYLAMADPRQVSGIVSIVFFDAVMCPVVTHELRRRFYRDDWFAWPMRRLAPRLFVITLGVSAALTAGVCLWAIVGGGQILPWQAALGIFLGFAWGIGGWVLIYYAVHARRRREALQLELAVVTREAQLRALRAQLNPHFLFNCLNSLRHLILVNPDRAVTMVTGLAELLRYSLASDRTDAVPLADELQVVGEYLELERVRFEERLSIERATDADALTAKVPPMLVLTLVENAIKHGISTLPAGGIVRVTARVTDAHVEIAVANTGTLKAEAQAAGYGLVNARGRLRLLYHGEASLTLQQDGAMTVANLRLPLAEPAGVDAHPLGAAMSGDEARAQV